MNTPPTILAAILALSVLVSTPVSAEEMPITVECPLGGGVANGIETLAMYTRDAGLDGRPYGNHTEVHPPPECVDNGFIVYKDDFTEAELLHVEKYVLSKEYQTMWSTGVPEFYRLAKIYEYLELPISGYAYFYLIATWNDYVYQKDRYEYYAREAIRAFVAAIKQMESSAQGHSERYVEFHYLLVELYRRVREFDNAQEKLDWIKQTNLDTSFLDPLIIEFQDYLISQGDSDNHMMSES